MLIANKAQFLDKYLHGIVGNTWDIWLTYDVIPSDQQYVNVRSKMSGWQTRYGIPREEAKQYDSPNFYFNPPIPDDLEATLLIQGEVKRDERGLCLFYDQTPGLRMKPAMQRAKQITGLRAKLMLEAYLWPNSVSMIEELLDMYPDHVIEFSTYQQACGKLRGHNTIIWEIRKY